MQVYGICVDNLHVKWNNVLEMLKEFDGTLYQDFTENISPETVFSWIDNLTNVVPFRSRDFPAFSINFSNFAQFLLIDANPVAVV